MRPKSLLLLALALGCGLVASIGISQVMDRNGNTHVKLETTPIYVARHNINVGDAIDEKMVSLEEWPKGKVPHGAISSLEALQGRRPRTAIIEGEPILEGKLLEKGQMADPIRAIAKGMRLYTIKVDAEKSAAGLLGPGDRVDVQLFVHRDQRNGIDTAKSKIILQNIRVFAVDSTVQRSADGSEEHSVAKTISLLLKPEQASKLALAAQIGDISLIPRNPDDESTASWSETTVDDLLGDGEANSRAKEQGVSAKDQTNQHGGLLSAIRAAATPKPPFRMEIVKGAQPVEEALFDPATGQPIHPTKNEPAGPTPLSLPTAPTTGSAAPTSTKPVKPADADKMLEDFPIDFGHAK